LCVFVATAEDHSRVVGRPPHCGPKRPASRSKLIRTLTADESETFDQRQQPALKATVVPPPSPVCATAVRQQSSLHTQDESGFGLEPSPGESSCTVLRRETDADVRVSRGGDDVSAAVALTQRDGRRQRAALSLDDVDLWEDFSESADPPLFHCPPRDNIDFQHIVLTDDAPFFSPPHVNSDSGLFRATTATSPTLPTTTVNQTWSTDLTTISDNEHHIRRNGRHKQHPTSSTLCVCSVSVQTDRPTTSADDTLKESNWRCSSPIQAELPSSSSSAAAAARCARRGFVPNIVESSGRPATANSSAADLSNGSVELRQRSTGAGLDLYVRAMQLGLIDSCHRSTTMTKDVKVCEAKITQSSRRSNSSLDAVQPVEFI